MIADNGSQGWGLRDLIMERTSPTIFSQVKKAEPVTSDSYLNDTAGSQGAEVQATVSCSSQRKAFSPLHILT